MSSRTRDLPVDLPDGATRAAAGIAVVGRAAGGDARTGER